MSRPQKGRKPAKRWHRRAAEQVFLDLAWPATSGKPVVWGEPRPLRQGRSGFNHRSQRS